MENSKLRWIRCVWAALLGFGLLVWFLAFAWEHDTAESIPVHAGILLVAAVLLFASPRPSLRWALALLAGASIAASGIALELRSAAMVRAEAQALEHDRLGTDYPRQDEAQFRLFARAREGDRTAIQELVGVLKERRPGWGPVCGVLARHFGVSPETADVCTDFGSVCGTGTGPLGRAIRWRNQERMFHQEALRIRELVLFAVSEHR